MTGEPRPGDPRRLSRDGGSVTRGAGPVYFHGGIPGLAPGDLLLPPRVTGTRPRQAGDEDHVHITTSRRYALEYAAAYAFEHDGQPGAVYEVLPDGPLRPGEDRGQHAPSDRWCAKASVLRVAEAAVGEERGYPAQARRAVETAGLDPAARAWARLRRIPLDRARMELLVQARLIDADVALGWIRLGRGCVYRMGVQWSHRHPATGEPVPAPWIADLAAAAGR